jgi:hypothetical protein
VALASCGAEVDTQVNAGPAPDQVVDVQDEYDYYPAYGVYFNPYRHLYYYQENGAWINRPGPPGVSVDVLLASPRVRMDFHDHPRYHHEVVAHRYPQNWNGHQSEPRVEEHR